MLTVKPGWISLGKDEEGNEYFACYCSNCHAVIFKHNDHCQYCGCRIEWGDDDELVLRQRKSE